MSLKERIEENAFAFLATAVVAGFIAGWGAPEAIRKVEGRTTVPEHELTRLQKIEADQKNGKDAPVAPTREEPKRTKVAVVDNVRTVYDPASIKKGRTNFDDIYDSLNGEKNLELSRVQIYEGWADYPLLKSLQPDIIVVHASAFYNTTNANDEERHLKGFLSVVAKDLPSAKVVVYSRSIISEQAEASYAGRLIAAEHALEGRLFALSVPSGAALGGGSKSSFKSASNISRLKAKLETAGAN